MSAGLALECVYNSVRVLKDITKIDTPTLPTSASQKLLQASSSKS
jgi:hypothetical protein